ncbi:hypothetical protein L6452_33010 [Arctium lappa]|uniref:Uncharacterized protein n=1 Tax=Arctium lappa TaxID=4217 RepID=A0ACB8Z5B3_ARCLA|nr:hypothetical protein L6452_33010 [Arctium lappa]
MYEAEMRQVGVPSFDWSHCFKDDFQSSFMPWDIHENYCFLMKLEEKNSGFNSICSSVLDLEEITTGFQERLWSLLSKTFPVQDIHFMAPLYAWKSVVL